MYIIRNLTKNDYLMYLSLINDFRPSKFDELKFINTLHTIEKTGEIYVIEQNNELIATGTILYEWKFIYNISKVGHIEDICVKSEYRNKGYGKIIVNHLVEMAKRNECYKVTLDCSESNSSFYEKCDFEKRGCQMSKLLQPM